VRQALDEETRRIEVTEPASLQIAAATIELSRCVLACLRKARQERQTPACSLHDLRHSFGTLALASGVDLQTVSRALGHESTAITSRIYLHAVETLQDDAAARIDALLGNAVAGALAKPPIPTNPTTTLRQTQGDKESAPQRCHVMSLQTKNALRFERFVVAPTGIEPVNRGPGRSR
jgi:hypothetical protein